MHGSHAAAFKGTVEKFPSDFRTEATLFKSLKLKKVRTKGSSGIAPTGQRGGKQELPIPLIVSEENPEFLFVRVKILPPLTMGYGTQSFFPLYGNAPFLISTASYDDHE